ncbi:hypothetical protein AGMMS49593_08590 [Endomicrobiia bacterium]|nr:hypothetical protein AGMMS49593_08590 [Endomicrobiia bacterium]
MFVLASIMCLIPYIYIVWCINSGLDIRHPYRAYLYIVFTIIGIASIFLFVNIHHEMPFMSVIGPLGYMGIGIGEILFSFLLISDILNLSNLIFKIKKIQVLFNFDSRSFRYSSFNIIYIKFRFYFKCKRNKNKSF